ncbi:MAG TPA: hypothetical protein VGR01_03095 [Burkholderiales bacterium]|jgi:hypothetical protein|nr:hypothetical protein [Burkholderiales bacterium]
MKFINQLLSQHIARYPRMQLDDIYKLLHQAALGPGHAVKDAAAARAWLEKEAAELGPGPAETEKDIISPDGRLARVHLRSWVTAGRSLDDLNRAFVETANSYPPSRERLEKFCGCLGDLAAAGGIPFAQQEVVAYFDRIAQGSYPVVHHSKTYTDAYKPAYRVVAIDYMKLT